MQFHIGDQIAHPMHGAGVIESRSSGMRGTYIKVLNDAVFAELDAADKWAGLAAIPAVTRASSICSIFFLKPMEGSSYEKMERKAKGQAVFVMVLMPALSLAAGPEAFAAALAAAAVTWAAILRGSKQLGGMSGDVSGYAISLGELVGALTLALI